MNSYPFAVISPTLGTRSETFIYRHMADLLPGKTLAIVRNKVPQVADFNIRFPFVVLVNSRLNFRWLYQSGLFFLKLSKLSPVQMTVEQLLREHRVKAVLSEFLHTSLKWLEITRKLGIRFFAHAHGSDVSQTLIDPTMRRLYLKLEDADGIITMSEYSRKKLIGIGLSGTNIHVIPYGINVPDSPQTRKHHSLIRCLAVGRMVGKKAPIFTLEAFRRALNRNPYLMLDYVGDGDLFDEARQFVQAHALKERVVLHGSQSNRVVQELMKGADIFLQHSRTDPVTGDEEGLPVAILEAMANSLPIVATRHSGIPEAVVEGVSGYLVDEGDIESMASHVVQLANAAELRNKLGKAGWLRVKQNFSWEQEKKSMLKVIGL